MLSVRFRWINFPLIYSTPNVTCLEPSTEAEQFLDMLRLAPAGRNMLAELSSSKMEVQDGLNSSS